MRWGVLLLLGVFFVSFSSAVIPGDCESSMIAYWKMDGDATDSYWSHDGSGGYFIGDILKVGTAAKFRGSDKITIPNAADLDFDSAFTIEMWIMESDLPSTASLFEKGNYQIEYVVEGSAPFQTHYIRASAGSVTVSSGSLTPNTPYHIALVWDSSGAELNLYVDGVNVSEAVMSSAANAGGNLIVGDGFTGLIDELAIYSTVDSSYGALSGSLINAHYLLGSVGKDYCDASGAGGGSSTKAVFNIRGCNFDVGDGETFGVAKGRCSSVPYDGQFFCSEDQEAFVTSDWGLGCAMGDANYDVNNNNDFCCPPGNFCNESETGGVFQCDRRTENCFDQEDKTACNDIGCIWLPMEGEGGECSDGLRDYGCGFYENESACVGDEWNLGQVGIGTELCGTTFECNGETFSVPEGDCACGWYPSAPIYQKCQVKLVGVQMFYDTGTDPDKFECNNAYELGNCTDGEQEVTWSSNYTGYGGFSSGVPNECLDALGCDGGEGTRYCGEPIIKLPMFSLFSLIASVAIFIACYGLGFIDADK